MQLLKMQLSVNEMTPQEEKDVFPDVAELSSDWL